MIGFLDGAPKYFEFNKCNVSNDQQNYVCEWNRSLVYCRGENNQYTINMFDINNGNTKTKYLIAMNKTGSETSYYENITEEVTTTQSQFDAYVNNHTTANEGKTWYGTLHSSFTNVHGFVIPDGSTSELLAHPEANQTQYITYKVIKVIAD